jgi:hypothetical protein
MTGAIISTPPTVELPPGNTTGGSSVLPGVTYTYAVLNFPQTWTAKQTFPLGNISIQAEDIIGGTLNPARIGALPSAVFANPSASIGLTANSGSASTSMRSDATPALSQAITPTWTGTHNFAPTSGNVTQSIVSNGTLPSTGTSTTTFNLSEINLVNPGYTVTGVTLDSATGGFTATNALRATYTAAGGSPINSAIWGAAKQTASTINLTGVIGSAYSNISAPSDGLWGAIGFTSIGASGNVGAAISFAGESIAGTGAIIGARVGIAGVSETNIQGTNLDAAFAVATGPAPGIAPYSTTGPWKYGFVLSRILYGNQGPPLSTNGKVMYADTAFTTTDFADMGAVTFTGNLFNFTSYAMDSTGSAVFGSGSGSLVPGVKISKTSSTAFQIVPNGGLSTFQVDTSAAGATGNGLYVFGQTAGSGVRLITVSSTSNEKILIDSKGTGLIDIGGISTGGVRLGNGGGGVAVIGTATNDNAASGVVGEYTQTSSGANNASATVTMTIAAPCVVTWTGHGFAVGAMTTAIKFTTTGALPTGITSGTTYYIKAIDANTFNIATTADNALAGTFITATGSQSGTHTGDIRVSMASLTLQNVAAISLGAGDWEVSGQMLKGAGLTTTVTYLAGNLTTSSASVDRTFGRRLSFQYGGLTLGNTEFTVFDFAATRFSLSGTTTIYLVADDSFGTSSMTCSGWLRARRDR